MGGVEWSSPIPPIVWLLHIQKICVCVRGWDLNPCPKIGHRGSNSWPIERHRNRRALSPCRQDPRFSNRQKLSFLTAIVNFAVYIHILLFANFVDLEVYMQYSMNPVGWGGWGWICRIRPLPRTTEGLIWVKMGWSMDMIKSANRQTKLANTWLLLIRNNQVLRIGNQVFAIPDYNLSQSGIRNQVLRIPDCESGITWLFITY
jgi:hypothetical protein